MPAVGSPSGSGDSAADGYNGVMFNHDTPPQKAAELKAAADTEAQARAACDAFEIEYEPLTPVLDVKEAYAQQDRLVHEQLGQYFGVADGNGVLVWEVEKGSAADKAGVKAGDVLSTIGKKKEDSLMALMLMSRLLWLTTSRKCW